MNAAERLAAGERLRLAAQAAYRALCELEDELDRADFNQLALSESERWCVEQVDRRWAHDTRRKIRRAVGLTLAVSS